MEEEVEEDAPPRPIVRRRPAPRRRRKRHLTRRLRPGPRPRARCPPSPSGRAMPPLRLPAARRVPSSQLVPWHVPRRAHVAQRPPPLVPRLRRPAGRSASKRPALRGMERGGETGSSAASVRPRAHPQRAARTPAEPRGEAHVFAVPRPLRGDARRGGRARGDWGEGPPGLDALRMRPGRRQEPSRRGRAFVLRPPGVVDVRERASKWETPSRGREGAKRGGCGGARRAELGWAGAAARSAPALSAGAVADGERFRRRLRSTSVADAAGTGRSGREASPGGPADRGGDGASSAERGRTGASRTA